MLPFVMCTCIFPRLSFLPFLGSIDRVGSTGNFALLLCQAPCVDTSIDLHFHDKLCSVHALTAVLTLRIFVDHRNLSDKEN